MKIAVTYENGEVFQHFGRTPQFKIYEIDGGAVTGDRVVDTGEAGHGALAGFLQDEGVEVMICGGIGGGAVYALNDLGIRVCAGASGKTDDVIRDYLSGNLPQIGDATCDCHEHEEDGGHDCGCHHNEEN